MTDYTPGPWKLNGRIIEALRYGRVFDIAEVFQSYSDPEEEGFVTSDWEKPTTEGKANAELIASAPRLKEERDELLEMVVFIEDLLSRRPFSSELWPGGEHPRTIIDKIRELIERMGHE